jgi:hypothetical protein
VSKGPIDSTQDTEYLKADGSEFGDAPRCDVCGEFVDGRPWLPPFRVELTLHGSEWGDFAFFGESDFLVSERTANVLSHAGISGLSGFDPVEVIRTRGTRLPAPAYCHVVVARSRAVVDERRSRLIRPKPPGCDYCRSAPLEGISGFVIEPNSWDGVDVFVARGLTGVVLASRAFRDVVHSAGLTNIRLTPTSSYEWNPDAPVSIPRSG